MIDRAYVDFVRSVATEAQTRHVVEGVASVARMIACAAVDDVRGVALEAPRVSEHVAKAAYWKLAERHMRLAVLALAYREAKRNR